MAYRTLDCDEAEEKFAERGKILNLWATQLNKKLKPDQGGDDDDLDDEDGKKGKKKGAKKADNSFKIHDGDDFGGSGDESFGDDSDEEEEKKKKKANADSDDDDGKINVYAHYYGLPISLRLQSGNIRKYPLLGYILNVLMHTSA